jgi:hypothetical protein
MAEDGLQKIGRCLIWRADELTKSVVVMSRKTISGAQTYPRTGGGERRTKGVKKLGA